MDFSKSQLQKARYWYEKLPYTHLSGSLTSGLNNIFNVYAINTNSAGPAKLAILGNLAVTQSDTVSLVATNMGERVQIATAAMPGSLTPTMTDTDRGLRSTNTLELQAVNNGAPVANYQINYTVAVKTLSTAEKMFQGLPLTPADTQYANQFHLNESGGMRPLAISESLKRVFGGQIRTEREYASLNNSSVGAVLNLTPAADEVLVVTGLASNAPLGNMVTLSITRDDDQDYVQVLADSMSVDTPVPMWLPVLRNMNLSISAQTATDNVVVRVTTATFKRSMVIQALFGLIDPAGLSGSQLNLYQQVMAGVVV